MGWKLNESEAYQGGKTDAELLEELRKLPDFEKYPLPASWYKKFNLKPIEAVTVKTYIDSGACLKAITGGQCDSYEFKEPQRDENGNLLEVKVFPLEEIPVEVITKPIREIPLPLAKLVEQEQTEKTLSETIDEMKEKN
jgi:hypothetical protein